MRPDRCGAVVLLSLPWHGEVVISAIPAGRAIPEKTLDWLKTYAQENARPLIFYERIVEAGEFTGIKAFGFGPPAFRKKVAMLPAGDSAPSL
jgi:hypothetical protein